MKELVSEGMRVAERMAREGRGLKSYLFSAPRNGRARTGWWKPGYPPREICLDQKHFSIRGSIRAGT